MDGLGSIIGAIGNIVGGVVSSGLNYDASKRLNEQNYQYNKSLQEQAQEYDREKMGLQQGYNLENLQQQQAYNKEMQDYTNAINIMNKLNEYSLNREALERAGYNPMLALGGGGGIAPPSGSAGSGGSPSGGASANGVGAVTSNAWDGMANGISNAATLFAQRERLEAETKNIESKTKYTDKGTEKIEAEIDNLKAQTDECAGRLKLLSVETKDKLQDIMIKEMGPLAKEIGTAQVLALYQTYGTAIPQAIFQGLRVGEKGLKAVGGVVGAAAKFKATMAAIKKLADSSPELTEFFDGGGRQTGTIKKSRRR